MLALAETLMRQTLFGESRGVGILRTFQGQYAAFFANTPLERELRGQIADEARHARSYARMLAKRDGTQACLAGVDPGWRTIMSHIATAHSFSTTLIGMYGLMEPFNLLSIQAFLLPLLDEVDLAEVNQIAKDEARHIGMFELFAELVERRVLPVDEAECLAMIRVFFEALRDGIALPSGERINLPRSEWREFMRHVGQLRGRIAAWSEAASPTGSRTLPPEPRHYLSPPPVRSILRP
jgi:hypothetical protein